MLIVEKSTKTQAKQKKMSHNLTFYFFFKNENSYIPILHLITLRRLVGWGGGVKSLCAFQNWVKKSLKILAPLLLVKKFKRELGHVF